MSRLTITLVALALLGLSQVKVGSQVASRPGLIGDMVADIKVVESKLTSLAESLPDSAWAWRPRDGVRSAGEVIVHVAADNYLMPAGLGISMPAGVPIDPRRMQSVAEFEKRNITRQQAMKELSASFAFLKQNVEATTETSLGEPVKMFGRVTTRRATWLEATTHLHEHLGQLIAYARSNGVVPPWSR